MSSELHSHKLLVLAQLEELLKRRHVLRAQADTAAVAAEGMDSGEWLGEVVARALETAEPTPWIVSYTVLED